MLKRALEVKKDVSEEDPPLKGPNDRTYGSQNYLYLGTPGWATT